jgi:sulfur carrier protein ThiS
MHLPLDAMKVSIERDESVHQIADCATGTALLKKLSLCAQEVILTKNGEIIMPEESLSENDEIRVLSVISGG